MASLRLQALLLCSALQGACAMEAARGLGDDDGAEEDPFSLRWVDSSALLLSPGESRIVEVLYADPEGQPAIDYVGFALVGGAQDASLSLLEQRTDARGATSVDLFASSIAATFRLRASAPLAPEIYLDVSVSDAGFGNLLATPRFVGHREGIEDRDARVFSGIGCAELDPLALPPGDRSLVVDSLWNAVTFPGIAAGPTYAVTVTGNVGGTPVSYGCADGATIAADQITEIEVVVDDLLPSPVGEYDVVTDLDLADAIPGEPEAWLEPSRALLTAEGDSADYFVARIAAYVEATYDAAARGRFESAVGDATTLRAALSTLGRDPALLVDRIAIDVEEGLLSSTLHSVLRIDPTETGYDAIHDLYSVEVAGEAIGIEVPASFALADLSVVSQGTAEVTLAVDDSIDIGTHELAFPIGSIAAALSDEVLPSSGGASDLAGWISNTVDCPDVAQILSAAGADADCDVACLSAGCVEASVHLASSITSSLRAADESFARIVISGRAQMFDEGGDLRAEQLTSGNWLGVISPAEAIMGGGFTGTRIEKAE